MQKNNHDRLTGIILSGGKSSRFGFNKLEIRIEKTPLFIDQIFKLSFFCSQILLITSSKNHNFLLKELEKIGHYRKFYGSLNFDIPVISVIDDEKIFTEESGSAGSMLKKRADDDSKTSFGPVIGLYTGLKNAVNHYSIVLAFDMPFISKKILDLFVLTLKGLKLKSVDSTKKGPPGGSVNGVIIKTANGYEVLCGIYSKNCIGALKENMAFGNLKISDIFSRSNMKIITEDLLAEKGIDGLNFFNINNIEDYYIFTDVWKSIFSGLDFYSRWEKFFYR